MDRSDDPRGESRNRRVGRRSALGAIGAGLASALPFPSRTAAIGAGGGSDGTKATRGTERANLAVGSEEMNPPTVEWSRTFDEFEGLEAMARTGGGYVVAGTLVSEVVRAAAAKVDADGTAAWTTLVEPANPDVPWWRRDSTPSRSFEPTRGTRSAGGSAARRSRRPIGADGSSGSGPPTDRPRSPSHSSRADRAGSSSPGPRGPSATAGDGRPRSPRTRTAEVGPRSISKA